MSNVSNYESICGNDEKPHYTENCQELLEWSSTHLLELLWNCSEEFVSASRLLQKSDFRFKKFSSRSSPKKLPLKQKKWKPLKMTWICQFRTLLPALEGEIFATKACQSLTKDFPEF